ncbi:hypothetical protein ACHAAC_01220 [Aeromicrobium sp. CF4.19]|uniref:hypothetical protein n=1 Tax=Aeromicrobium sp. CF4.19 TaxID=3373082 RepID=UPI003EE50A3C
MTNPDRVHADGVPAHRPTAASVPPASTSTAAGPVLPSSRGWVVLAWLAPLVCLVVHAYVLWGTTWPGFPYDEIGLLQISRQLGGEEISDGVRGKGYFPLWAVLTTPVWWFTSDPSIGYQATLWAGVPVSLLTIWPLALIVRRLGLATAPSVVVASFVMILPARAIQADFSMSERLVTLVLVCVVLAAFRVAERPTVLRHLVFAAALGLLFFSHVRMSVVLAAAAVWLLIRLPRHVRSSAIGLVFVAIAYYVTNWAGRSINEMVLSGSFRQGDGLLDKLGESRPSLFLRVGIGQAWNQSLASYGLVTIGLVVLVVLVWRELRRWDFGALTFVLGATAAIVLVSLTQWANDFLLFDNPWVRLDAWVYGRYIDPIATVLVAIGLAALLRGVSRSVALWAVGLNVVTAAAAVVVLSREVPTWGFVTPAHIPGILPWNPLLPDEPWPRDEWIVPSLTNENQIWIIAPLCVLVVLIAALALWRRPVLVGAALVVLATLGTVIGSERTDQFHASESQWLPMRDHLTGITTLDPDDPVGFVRPSGEGVAECEARKGSGATAHNYFGYAVAPAPLRELFEPEDIGDLEIVLACERWSIGEDLGARRLDTDSVYASYVWIMPGELQDELAAEDRLVPPGDL